MADVDVAVIGAGIGGLCAAVRLASAGLRVTVLERADGPGGKMRSAVLGGRRIDVGPTVLTLPDVFEAVFEEAGERMSDHVALLPQTLLARHAWPDGSRLDLHADPARSEEAVGRFAGAAAARGYRAFRARAASVYGLLDGSFVRGARPASPLALAARVGVVGLPGLMRAGPYSTLWDALGGFFPDPRLRQLFGRYATYCGSSPFEAPATLMLIAHVEAMGVHVVRGGMARLAEALAALASRCGASLRFGAEVASVRVRGGRPEAVLLADGDAIGADAVVVNGDLRALAGGRLGRGAAAAVSHDQIGVPSLSAGTTAFLGRFGGDLEPAFHTVLFSGDYRAEFDALRRGRLPERPTVYLCAQDRAEGDVPSADADGPERGFTIVNAPPAGGATSDPSPETDAWTARTFAGMAACGLRVDREETVSAGPRDFATLFPGSGGSLYGAATHGATASFRRPGARSRMPGLYLAGGGVHPGAGIPMAALSGRQAAEALLSDLASTRRSVRAAMPGGISTR